MVDWTRLITHGKGTGMETLETSTSAHSCRRRSLDHIFGFDFLLECSIAELDSRGREMYQAAAAAAWTEEGSLFQISPLAST
jgi:hypothetical protein